MLARSAHPRKSRAERPAIELAVVMVLRTPRPALRSAPSRLLVQLTLAVAALALTLPYVRPVAARFDFVPLPLGVMGMMLAIVAACLAVTEAAKLRFFAAGRADRGSPGQ